eukprot:349124-Alexandrium_andersonii.AAC.1
MPSSSLSASIRSIKATVARPAADIATCAGGRTRQRRYTQGAGGTAVRTRVILSRISCSTSVRSCT